jgi:transposase
MCAYLATRQALLVHWREMKETNDSKLAKLAGCSTSVATKWRKRFEQNDESLKDAPRCGRPRALDAKELQRLRNAMRRGPKKTAPRATFLVNKHRSESKKPASVRTVTRRIADDFEFGEVPPESISADNVLKRKAATTPRNIKIVEDKLHLTVCVDAAQLLFKKGEHVRALRRRRDWHERGERRKQSLGGWGIKVVYAAVALGPDRRGVKSPLIWVPGPKGLNSGVLTGVVLPALLEWAAEGVVAEGEVPVWLLDGASPHTAHATQQWMVKQNMILASHPAGSPDLNPQEKSWLLLKSRLERSNRRPRDVDAFRAHVERDWNAVPAEQIKRNIEALPSVMKRVHVRPGKLDNKM